MPQKYGWENVNVIVSLPWLPCTMFIAVHHVNATL